MLQKKPRLTLPLEQETQRLFEAAAFRSGKPLIEWAVSTLVAATSEIAVRPMSLSNDAVDAAFDAMAKEDEGESRYPGIMPLPPESKKVVVEPVPAVVPVPEVVLNSQTPYSTQAIEGGHPCVFLLPQAVVGYSLNEHQGKCQHNNAGDRKPCFWAGMVAKNCLDYRPRRVRMGR